jgi:hypothetical protein
MKAYGASFGYYRDWPGYQSVYERVSSIMGTFLRLRPQAGEIGFEVSDDPADYPNLDVMRSMNQKMGRALAVQDVRYAGHPKRTDNLIYDDEFLTVISPLTYAASVRYGNAGWPLADPKEFNKQLDITYKERFISGWQHTTAQRVPVFLNFKVPMPSSVSVTAAKGAARHTLKDLALYLERDKLDNLGDPDTWSVNTEDNRRLSVDAVKTAIRNEPNKEQPDPSAIYVTAPAIKTPEQAEEIIQHLDQALVAVEEWAAQFDPQQIVTNAFGD